MSRLPDVTIGVPVYRGELFIEEALRSIQSQTHQSFKVIISLDGPDPVSEKLCQPFLQDSRFELFVQPERLGWVGNLNWLIAQVETPYWYFHQQDDLVDPRYLEVLLAHAEQHPEAANVYCDIVAFGSLTGKFFHSSVTGTASARLLALLYDHHSAVPFRGLTRLEALRESGGICTNEVENASADTTWVASIARSGELLRVPVELYHKRYHSDNTHTKWAQWPLEKRTKAWVTHCADMLAQAMLVEATVQERRLLWLAAVGRLISPHTAFGYITAEGLTEVERKLLLNEFLSQIKHKLNIPVWLEAQWEDLYQWTSGFYGSPLSEQISAIQTELKSVSQELYLIQTSRIGRLMVRWWRFRVHLRTLNPFDWLKHQQFYWRFRTSTRRRVARILPAFLKRTIKATRFYARQEFFQPKLSKPVNAIPSLLPQEFQSLAIYPELSANHQFDKSETKIHRSKIDIIAYSVIDWETRYQRPQQIMAQFAAQGHRIFYLSTSRFLPPDAKAKFAVREICPNVFEVSVAAHRVPNVYSEVMDGENQKVMMESLQELRRLYRIDEAVNYVMLASWGSLALATQQEWGWQTLYDCMDEWATFPGIKPALLEMELKLVQESDLIVVTAQRLFDKWKKYERPMVLARNAVDYDFYQGRCQPNPLLPEVKNPVIGYYGAIADWFDVELMAFVAAQRPDYTFVLLGGVFDIDVSVLQVLPNVRLLGHQLYETMPQYLYHFDACIIPFKINAVTEATDPVKLYEYLSGGKPVVAVAMPELENYRDHIYIARDREDFPVQLDRALCEDNAALAAQRRALAQKHTWKNRQEIIEAGLIEVTPKASIIIVTWHNLAMTKLCIESLLRNTNYLNYEIIVVDNNSEDGTPDYLQTVTHEHSHVKIILNATNYGFAKANNQGIEISSGEHIVLLNNDTIVPRGWLSRLLHHLGDPEIGIVGPMTNAIGNEAKIEVPYRTWSEMEDFAAAHVAAHHLQIADIKMLAMYCVAFRRETYEKIGPLDEQYGIGMFEDDDYSERIKAAGLRVVCAADVFVHHFGQASFKKLIANGAYNPLFEENRRRFEVKWQRAWVAHKHATLSYRIHHIPEHF